MTFNNRYLFFCCILVLHWVSWGTVPCCIYSRTKTEAHPNLEYASCIRGGKMKELHSTYSSGITSPYISLAEASYIARPDIDQIGSINLTNYGSPTGISPVRWGQWRQCTLSPFSFMGLYIYPSLVLKLMLRMKVLL